MNSHRFCRRLMLVLTTVGLTTPTAIAQLDLPAPPKASLLRLTLTPGGSVDPPGDRLVATVLIYAGTDRVDLELEAEVVDEASARPGGLVPGAVPRGGDRNPAGAALDAPPAPRAVLAKDETHRGPEGRFRLVAAAQGKEGATVAEVPLVVPLAALDLPPTGHLIRYTLRGSVAGADVFSTATRLFAPAGAGLTRLRPPEPPPAASAPMAPPEVLTPAPTAADPDRVLATRPGERDNPTSTGDSLPTPGVTGRGGVPPIGAFPDVPNKSMPAYSAAPSLGGSMQVAAPVAPDLPFAILRKRPVVFATNRTVRGATGTPSERFGDGLDAQVRYGSCLVNVPVDQHIQGKLELPGWFTGRDPARFFLIDTTSLLPPEAFRSLARGTETRGDLLVYVHGFNTPFDSAVMRLAQVVHDIQFGGVPVAFSWPSRGSKWSYDADEVNAMRSVEALANTLLTLVEAQASRPEGLRGKVHVLAHSLGNRVTLQALARLDGQLAAGRKPFGQIILAAPDVSVAEFSRRVPSAQARADRVSLYFCPDDQALLASQVRHPNEPRAGRGVVPLRALDNVDARKANTSFLGHGYWSDAKQLLIDMQMLINLGWSPEQRVLTLLPATVPPDYRYWSFR